MPLKENIKKFEEKVIGLLTNLKDYKGYEKLKEKNINCKKSILSFLPMVNLIQINTIIWVVVKFT